MESPAVSGNGIPRPALTLPKGGGALRGIGETFQPDPFTGTAAVTIPIHTSPCRGTAPSLSLTYSTGNGNGPFGLGFSLSVPSISRRTRRGVPRYAGEDVFVLSGAEDLVPALARRGDDWVREERREGEYRVAPFRPRTEGPFARVEQYEHLRTREVHWEVTTRDGVRNVYGRSAHARVVDPGDPARVFSWLLEETRDARGNRHLYLYESDDPGDVPDTLAERGRAQGAQRYLKRVRYGNYRDAQANERWAFEAVFDYGDHDPDDPSPAGVRVWEKRPDSFSSYRSGFEIRTHRLCRRVLMFHRIPELGEEPYLVRSTDFTYASGPTGISLLTAVQHRGYRRREGGSDVQADPPLELAYSGFDPRAGAWESLDSEGSGLADQLGQGSFRMIDLWGEGVEGILYSWRDSLLYWRAEGGGRYRGPMNVLDFPREAGGGAGGWALADLEGDGKLDVVVHTAERAGYYQGREGEHFAPFQAFESAPLLGGEEAAVEEVDVEGDGWTDLLRVDQEEVHYFSSRGNRGFAPEVRVGKDRALPPLNPAARQEIIRFADVFGDGLAHRVRIRNGSVEVWPNLGHGRFGAKVSLENAPHFGEAFHPERVRLGDLDGSGTTDLLYLHPDRIDVFFNLSGNAFSPALSILLPWPIDRLDHLQIADVLGQGTACVVVSGTPPGEQRVQHRFHDLTGGAKPHLLTGIDNNLGATTRVRYASSTHFYLRDQREGRPWISRLPFPVHLVEATERIDHLSGSKLVTRYRYHHGSFDGVEREFQGFGCVEQWDTEAFEQYAQTGLHDGVPFAVGEPGLHVPPVHSRTWFHTGRYVGAGAVSRELATEYYAGDPDAPLLPDTVLDPAISAHGGTALREAHRALRGRVLRQEIYAQDARPGLSEHPYLVTEHSVRVRMVQPPGGNPHAVFVAHPHESLSSEYERVPDDPRIAHTFTLEVDPYGQVLRSCTLHYPRRLAPGRAVHPEQGSLVATATLVRVINTTAPFHLLGVACEQRTFELGGLRPADRYFSFDEVAAQVQEALDHAVSYEQDLEPGQRRARLLSWQQSYYTDETHGGALPLGETGARALLHHVESAAFPEALVPRLYGNRVTPDLLRDGAGYRLRDGYWWNPGIVQEYGDAAAFFLPTHVVDPFGNRTEVAYDPYALTLVRIVDALRNHTRAEIDYRSLEAFRLTDLNDNVQEVRFDALGRVVATTFHGEENGVRRGDDPVARYREVPDPTAADILREPARYLQNATSFFHYDLFAYRRWRARNDSTEPAQPPYFIQLRRTTHVSELRPGEETEIQVSLGYSDGFGRELQSKALVEPGPAFGRDGRGGVIEVQAEPRWLVSGRTVYDNKGNPVKRYEPFYSAVADYESERALDRYGVTPVIHYDPLARPVRTDLPKGFHSRVEIGPWWQRQHDANDTVRESEFFRRHQGDLRPAFADERDALLKAAAHARTPGEAHFDTLGRPFLEVAHLVGQPLVTHRVLDVQGNERAVTDPRQAILNRNRPPGDEVRNFRYDHDMAGNVLRTVSVDAGTSLALPDVLGNPLYSWDGRNRQVRVGYDALWRPTGTHVLGGGLDQWVERLEYGEGPGPDDGKQLNRRGQLVRHYDPAGIVENAAFSFKGELLRSTRRLRHDYRGEADWNQPARVRLANEVFVQESRYDALGRVIEQAGAREEPDGSGNRSLYRHRPSYHISGRLNRVEVRFPGESRARAVVESIAYDARGQRERICYGNGTCTEYRYEDETFRLARLRTYHRRDAREYQDIGYTYDPVGNVTRVRDHSHQRVFFDQQVVDPLSDYTYDALYRLTSASGREHPALGARAYRDGSFKQSAFLQVQPPQPLANDRALQPYTRTYAYDEAGNLIRLRHVAAQSARSFTRVITPAGRSNRAVPESMRNNLDPEVFFDGNGNLTSLEHLRALVWDCRDNLASATLITRSGKPDDAEYYVYDASGTRVRKVFERLVDGGAAVEVEEKIYLGGCEIRRIRRVTGRGEVPLFERETVHVMDDRRRIALVHHWTLDAQAREVDGAGQRRVHFQYGNHLGSAALELDEQARVISYEEYFAYGGTSLVAGRGRREVSWKEYRYTGKERDDSTGLYYYGARYYAAWIGRWLSADPAGRVDGPNLYRFVRGNPLSQVDPSGRQTTVLEQELADLEARAQHIAELGRQYWEPRLQNGPTISAGEDVPVHVLEARSFRSLQAAKEAELEAAREIDRQRCRSVVCPTPVEQEVRLRWETGEERATREAVEKHINVISQAGALLVPVGGPSRLLATEGGEGVVLLRTTNRGGGPFPLDKLKRIQKALDARGEGIQLSFSRANLRALKREKAAAFYDVETRELVFGPKPTYLEVVEELKHLGQHRKLKFQTPVLARQGHLWDIEAKEQILRLKSLSLTPEEIRSLEVAKKFHEFNVFSLVKQGREITEEEFVEIMTRNNLWPQ